MDEAICKGKVGVSNGNNRIKIVPPGISIYFNAAIQEDFNI
ncbi:hypothetical protein CLJU_c14690 [Clostridium ljungdahlii DSM 13528]|uniref:Uncharacterized protein n=1 Tax=Clostridium ljungdahlii (strain ATCC 55383 / DSM 13528 / PETC) TaxID=748727 RepID=D8GSW7_CLOLD|nr:hypothetical protein CLJU_c14690 [Clostridium ljungdahlii DSM 13528]